MSHFQQRFPLALPPRPQGPPSSCKGKVHSSRGTIFIQLSLKCVTNRFPTAIVPVRGIECGTKREDNFDRRLMKTTGRSM